MKKVNRSQWKYFLFLAIGLLLITTPIAQINAAPPVQAYQVASPLTVYQGDQLNASLSITQVYFEEIYNVTINTAILKEVKFLFSNIPALDADITNETDEFTYNFGILDVDEKILFTATYNVTSSDTKEVFLPSFNVTFQLRNGEERFVETNLIQIFLRGERETSETESLKPTPFFNIPADPFFSIIGLTLPLFAFAISIAFMRRLR